MGFYVERICSLNFIISKYLIQEKYTVNPNKSLPSIPIFCEFQKYIISKYYNSNYINPESVIFCNSKILTKIGKKRTPYVLYPQKKLSFALYRKSIILSVDITKYVLR